MLRQVHQLFQVAKFNSRPTRLTPVVQTLQEKQINNNTSTFQVKQDNEIRYCMLT